MFTDQFDLFVEDFLGEKSDRPLIIVGASKIDDLLFHILSKYLLPNISGNKDDLLEGDQPIATFSSRIKLIYRLGIIDVKLFKLLDQIRKIRNLCAHSLEFDLKKSPVREHIAELKKGIINRTSFTLTKARYFSNVFDSSAKELQCMLITICVILEAIHEKISVTSGIITTVSISKK